MKITVIIGSPRGMLGNTGRLLEEVMLGLSDDAEVELIDLSKRTVLPCNGCDHCHRTGNCHLKDDYHSIKESLLACDGFILASPNYIFSVPAQLKALFDRSGNIIHCLMLEDKYGAVVETSGGGEDEGVIRYMTRFINSTGAQSAGGIGSPMVGERSFPREEILFARARDLGGQLCCCIRERRYFPDQADYRNAFKARMERLVAYRQNLWIAERTYWLEHYLD